eukprot:scaffold353543_cov28-Attheya_sp.AAC.1
MDHPRILPRWSKRRRACQVMKRGGSGGWRSMIGCEKCATCRYERTIRSQEASTHEHPSLVVARHGR